MNKEVKKNYKVKMIENNEIISEFKLENSQKHILVNKVDTKKMTLQQIDHWHNAIQKNNPELNVLTIPDSFKVEIWKIED